MVEDSEREPPSVCGNAVSIDNNSRLLFHFDFSIHQALQQFESVDSISNKVLDYTHLAVLELSTNAPLYFALQHPNSKVRIYAYRLGGF